MTRPRPRLTTYLPILLSLTIALAWCWREVVFARQARPTVPSKTFDLQDVMMTAYEDQGKTVGKIGLYLEGETELCSSLVTGRFVIDPGKTPHPPHVHPDEEVMIIETGYGEISCGDKTTKVGPGSVMYTAPNVPHGIVNTGAEPLTFYFMKWLPRTAK